MQVVFLHGLLRQMVSPENLWILGISVKGSSGEKQANHQQGSRENMLSIAVNQQLSQTHNAHSSHTVTYLAVLTSCKIYAFWSFMYTVMLWFIQTF